jgi:hypothetical protein
MGPSAANPLLSLAGRTMAQLRELARNTPLAGVYSRLSRSQLIDALQKVSPEHSPTANDYAPAVVANSTIDGGSQVTFLPQDPQWAYVFWELGSADQQVPLEVDGTFRVQVPFRDGQQVYPIRAEAADGEQERSICLEFQRSTPEARVNSKQEAVLE